MHPKVDALAGKCDAFEFKTEALFHRGIEAKFNLAAGAEHALPGKRVGRIVAQKAGDGAVIERVAGGGGYLSVGCDFTFGDRANDAAKGLVTELVRAKAVAE